MTQNAAHASLSGNDSRLDRLCHFPLPGELPADASLVLAKNGLPSLLVGKRHIHSTFDPSREAARMTEPHRQAAAGILLGYGCGHTALAWQAAAARPLLVIECRPDLLPAGRSTAEDLPEDAQIFFVRAENGEPVEEDVLRFLRALPAASLKSLAWLETLGAVSLDPPIWNKARTAVKTMIANFLTNLFTELEFERLWFYNILTNSPLVAKNSRLRSFAGCLRGRSVVIIGAGPSLDRWLDWLQTARTHAVLLAVDTAVKPLAAVGILPHAVISLDGQIHNLHDFTGVRTNKMTLFADMTVHPAIPRLPFARRIFFETADITESAGRTVIISHPLTLWVKQAIGELGAARSGGNVGTSAIELARILGASRILLAGCDHAWPGGVTHSREAPAIQRLREQETRIMTAAGVMRNTLAKRVVIRQTDYTGQAVQSDIILTKYASWIAAARREAESEAITSPSWATLSREGLVIDGIPALRNLREADDFIGKDPLPEDVFTDSTTEDSESGAADLASRLDLLSSQTNRILSLCRPLPPIESVLELFADFPFLRRGYGAQVMHAEKTGDASWLLGEIRFQLERIQRILARIGHGQIDRI